MSSKFTKQVKTDHQRSRDVHRTVNRSAGVHDEIAKIDDRQERFERDSEEIDALFKIVERHPPGHPEYEAALTRIEHLQGWRHQLYVQTIGALKHFLRSLLREIGALLMLQARFVFIALVNVVFFGLAIWLFYAWATSK